MKRFLFFLLLSCIFAAPANAGDFYQKLSAAALLLTRQQVKYDPAYFTMPYPNGDVPADKGVCTDVVVRAYRRLGIDLQKEVHEDMKAYFAAYPQKWGLKKPDPNIDHRRVPNLQVFFSRKNSALPVTARSEDYRPGDIVSWMLPGNLPHIGMVVHLKSAGGARPLIVHNIGNGQVLEDCLFRFPITGHYRYGGGADR